MGQALASIAQRRQRLVAAVPALRARRLTRTHLFLLMVAIPTVLAIFYYGLVASNQYVSEARLIIRSVKSHKATGLEMLFQTFGISSTANDANAVQNYVLSRDAVRSLDEMVNLRDMYGNTHGSFFQRFPRFFESNSFEQLYKYYLEHVNIAQDASSGITKLTVVAFIPSDAKLIAENIIVLAEKFINKMNLRAQSDTIKSAAEAVARAELRVISAQRELTEFRFAAGLIDPQKDSSSVLDTITSLSTDLARVMAELQQTEKSSANNPALGSMKARVRSLRGSIEAERQKLSGADSALASKVADYEQLTLARAIAEASLTSANLILDTARQDARRQAIYIEEVVAPNLPDESTQPERFRMVLTVFVFSVALSSVTWLLIAGAKEHIVE